MQSADRCLLALAALLLLVPLALAHLYACHPHRYSHWDRKRLFCVGTFAVLLATVFILKVFLP